ncbi:MAG: beta-lactamase family protein [Pseudomonadales bacterium]|nr:beta-lactamase family protein [Pseudomonadales bacterium]
MNRRQLIVGAGSASLLAASGGLAVGSASHLPLQSADLLTEIDGFIWQRMARDRVPGIAACIVDRDQVIWSACYGWADIENRIPMSLAGIQNVASISKTVTSTAVMQLQEAGLLHLHDDINDHLEFSVRHPRAPEQPIRIRQLLTHTSSIADGNAYGRLYGCGDPRLALGQWLQAYFVPEGQYYSADENFHSWLPADEKFEYCNLSYGILARIVENVSGMAFPEYCRLNIFAPLGMRSTSWRIADIDRARHVVPYTWVEGGKARGPDWGGVPLGAIQQDGPTLREPLADGFVANCVYGHPNYPDGFLRTSVDDLSYYVRAYLSEGAYAGHRILERDTVRSMLSTIFVHESRDAAGIKHRRHQGLNWMGSTELAGELAWGHGGSDPGVNTDMRILQSAGLGAIVFTNTNGSIPWDITHKLLEVALRART